MPSLRSIDRSRPSTALCWPARSWLLGSVKVPSSAPDLGGDLAGRPCPGLGTYPQEVMTSPTATRTAAIHVRDRCMTAFDSPAQRPDNGSRTEPFYVLRRGYKLYIVVGSSRNAVNLRRSRPHPAGRAAPARRRRCRDP